MAVAANNAMFDPCFNRWLSTLLGGARGYYQEFLTVVPYNSRWGMDTTAATEKNKVLSRVMGYLVLLYWRAWDYNTWYAGQTDGCTDVLPLGSFITDKTVACLIREADCHGLDLRPLLRLAGVRPLPDGIGVMQIQANTGCNSILFQVDKARRTDAPPSVDDINYNV